MTVFKEYTQCSLFPVRIYGDLNLISGLYLGSIIRNASIILNWKAFTYMHVCFFCSCYIISVPCFNLRAVLNEMK